MKRIHLLALIVGTSAAFALPNIGAGNIGMNPDGKTIEEWFRVESHWSAAAQLPGVWAAVQGNTAQQQTDAPGSVFGVPASRALVERNDAGVITAVVVLFDPAKQGGVSALVKRLTTSVSVFQGGTAWTTQNGDKVNAGKELVVTLHQQPNTVTLRITRSQA